MSYQAQGYNQPHGQPGQPFRYPPPSGPSFPGLQMPYAQPAFAQNHNLIPGLAFGNPPPQDAWNPPPPPAEPKLVPAARYYQPIQTTKGPAVPLQNATRSVDGAVEEGEISEGQFDDLYEPADSTVIHHTDGPDDYDPANPSWLGAPSKTQGNAPPIPPISNGTGRNIQGSDLLDQAESLRSARDGSGSYSPYLSPREIQSSSNPLPPKPSTPIPPAQYTATLVDAKTDHSASPGDAVSAAKQQAQAAVLRLWPLNVKFDDYVQEGIDPSVLRSLFGDLGLDLSTTESSSNSQTNPTKAAVPLAQVSKPPQQRSPKSQIAVSTTAAPATQELATASLADKKAEERKDRIARLWAAKATKSSAPQASTPPIQGSSQQPVAESRPGQTEKEIKLQQKMEALQKSREARAQKAASKSVAPEPANGPSEVQAVQDRNLDKKPTPQSQKEGAIAGLVTADTGPTSSPANSRKRPVAADFVDAGPSHLAKRPFDQDRGDKFVIDVSEESEDEDVEMEMASGDEAAVLRSGPYIQRTTSFRDVPQLMDTYGRRQQFSTTGTKPTATPPNGLAHMDKKIEEMKRKIALAEARKKLKMALSGTRKETASLNSALPTTDISPGPGTPKPALRRVQSVDAPGVSDGRPVSSTGRSSPVLTQASSLRLPKLSDLSAEARKQRQDRYRSLSQTLPAVEGKLQTKVKKLHLLQAQVSRLEREIAQESAEKQQMEAELDMLQPMMDAPKSAPETNDAAETSEGQSDINMTDQPPATSEQQTPASAMSLAAAEGSGSPDVQESQPAISEPEASQPPADTVAVTSSETVDAQPGSPERVSGADSIGESDGEETGDGTRETVAAAADNQENVMQVDDVLVRKDEDSDDVVILSNRDADESQQQSPEPEAVPSQISVGANDSRPDQGLGITRESRSGARDGASRGAKPGFQPYQTPFVTFRDFRYHPLFATQVPGGLRSLTYSNKIDPKLPVCPNQLEGRQCPKGADCEYQHFESMKLPDDQILLQLGGTKLEGAERIRFNGGLRELLHDLREKNVKDFTRIAQGIVDYHNRFSGDPSKILSLGDVPL